MAWFADALTAGHFSPWSPPDRYDYSVPLDVGTPITSPVDGVVLPDSRPGDPFEAGYGRKDWGGQLDILSDVPDYGGLVVVDMIHFDTIKVQPGAQVKAGEVIGTSGGQLSGGNWPVHNPPPPKGPYSTGPHIGVAVKTYSPTPTNLDPYRLMQDLVTGRLSSQTYKSGEKIVGGGTVPEGPSIAGFLGVPSWLSDFSKQNWGTIAIQVGKLLAGSVLIIIAIIVLLMPVAEKTAAAASPALGVASSVAGIAASRATTKLRGAEQADLERRQANRKPSKPKPEGDFVTRREPGKRARTYAAGGPLAVPLAARPGSTAGTVSMPTKGTVNTGFPGRNKQRRADRQAKARGDAALVPHPERPTTHLSTENPGRIISRQPGESVKHFQERQKVYLREISERNK